MTHLGVNIWLPLTPFSIYLCVEEHASSRSRDLVIQTNYTSTPVRKSKAVYEYKFIVWKWIAWNKNSKINTWYYNNSYFILCFLFNKGFKKGFKIKLKLRKIKINKQGFVININFILNEVAWATSGSLNFQKINLIFKKKHSKTE